MTNPPAPRDLVLSHPRVWRVPSDAKVLARWKFKDTPRTYRAWFNRELAYGRLRDMGGTLARGASVLLQK